MNEVGVFVPEANTHPNIERRELDPQSRFSLLPTRRRGGGGAVSGTRLAQCRRLAELMQSDSSIFPTTEYERTNRAFFAKRQYVFSRCRRSPQAWQPHRFVVPLVGQT